MPAIPSIASFTGASVTEGEFKTALSNLHLFLTGLLGTDGTQAGGQAALGALLGAGSATKTAAYTVTSADRGKVIACSGTFTVTLPDASAVGSGFAVAVANYGTGTITVEPFSAQTIDGVSSKPLSANGMLVACAVSGEWLTVGGAPTASTSTAGIVQLSTSTSSTSTTLAATASAVKNAYDLAESKVSKDHGHNVVGSLCFAYASGASASIGAGGTLAGSALMTAGIAASGTGSGQNAGYMVASGSLSGTWRCLGYAYGTSVAKSATLWQRIS